MICGYYICASSCLPAYFSLSFLFFYRHAIAWGIMIMVTYRVRLFHRQFFYQILVFLNTLAKLLSKIGRCGSCILIAIQLNGNWIIWISWTVFFAPVGDWTIYRRIWKLSKKEVWWKASFTSFWPSLPCYANLCQYVSTPFSGVQRKGSYLEDEIWRIQAFPSFQDAEIESALSDLHRDFYDILDWLMQSEVKWIFLS